MMKMIQMPRIVFSVAIAAAMAIGGVVGNFATGVAPANAATSQDGAGPYAFTVTLNPDDDLLEAFLVDTRSGAVYRGDYDSQDKEIVWIRYVSPKFKN